MSDASVQRPIGSATQPHHVPAVRIRVANDRQVNPDGRYVLYWMTAFRRTRWNFALQRAVEWAWELRKPLLVLEALRCDYPWASDRFHAFILQGMKDNREHLLGTSARYFPYVERERGGGKGLLEALCEQACVVVGDDYPAFFLPRMIQRAAEAVRVRLEVVDANGLLPLRAAERVFPTAFAFRRFLQKTLPDHLRELPREDPLAGVSLPGCDELPAAVTSRWPEATAEVLEADPEVLRRLPIDHEVGEAPIEGGSSTAGRKLDRFLRRGLQVYATDRNHPDEEATSGLSPYLHFGHISVAEVFARVAEREEWSESRLHAKASGKRAGWWGMSEGAEAFLDELITWRELGFNMCWLRSDYDRFESLPDWARQDLDAHATDPRPQTYSLEEFTTAETHDPLWNAAQRQLLREGTIHNTLRMLWGKKILEWSASPREALEFMIELNNRFALDGRDPNSYTGIFWVLGRYDRPWFPERPIFGRVRFMSSSGTLRKTRLQEYLERFKG